MVVHDGVDEGPSGVVVRDLEDADVELDPALASGFAQGVGAVVVG